MSVFSQHLLLYGSIALVLPPVLIVVTMLFGKKTGHGFCYLALLLCAARLLIPTGWGYSILSFSQWELVRSPSPVVIERLDTDLPDNVVPDENGTRIEFEDNTDGSFSIPRVVLTVWIGSSVTFLFSQLALTCVAVNRIKKRGRGPSRELNTLYLRIASSMGITKVPELIQSDNQTVPHLVGLFSPCVILGAIPLTDDQIKLVLTHELQHYKRKDLLAKLFMLVVLSVFWWNPSVWWLTFRFQEEMECACDEDILDGKDGDERYSYGQVILHVLKSSKRTPILISTGFGFAKKSTTFYRFRDLLNSDKRKGGYLLILFAALLLTVSAVLVGCSSRSDAQPIVFYLGTGVELQEAQLSDLADSLVTPSKEGYHLKGWAVRSVQGENGSFAIDFEALWEPDPCDITYVLRGGYFEEDATNLYEAVLPIPSHPRYTFAGWYIDEDMTVAISSVPLTPTTVYAKWKEESNASDFIFRENKTGLTLEAYSGTAKSIVIPAYVGATPVTAIADNAFVNRAELVSVVLPETVTSIGVGAFRYCYSLVTVRLYCHLSYLDASVFSGCYELESLYFSGTKEEWERISKWRAEGVELHFAS